MIVNYKPRLQRIVESLQSIFITGMLLLGGSSIVLYVLQAWLEPKDVPTISTVTLVWTLILCAILVVAVVLASVHRGRQQRRRELLASERELAKKHYPDEQEILALKLQRNIYQMSLDLAYENGESDEDKDALLDRIEVLKEEIERLSAGMSGNELLEVRAKEKEKMQAIILPIAGHA